jgi:stage II sporulation protein D
MVSVGLFEWDKPRQLEVKNPDGTWTHLKVSKGQLLVNGVVTPDLQITSPLPTTQVRLGHALRSYPGVLHFSTAKDGQGRPFVRGVDTLDLEQYVACVVAAEGGLEATNFQYAEALAVAVRSYALQSLKRHQGFDLCDGTHCQVFHGLARNQAPFDEAAAETYATVLAGLKPSEGCFFSQCCGGTLDSAEAVWSRLPTPEPAPRGLDRWGGLALCEDDPGYRWQSKVPRDKLGAFIARLKNLPHSAHLEDLLVPEYTAGGRNRVLKADFVLPDGSHRSTELSGEEFVWEYGRRFGFHDFPSAFFDVTWHGEVFEITGRGRGHGVGLCQAGAYKLAQMGWGWREILNFYFPGARLETIRE